MRSLESRSLAADAASARPGQAHLPRVLVAILNWNRSAETITCLESAMALRYERCAVLLIDNGSSPQVVDAITTWALRAGSPLTQLGPTAEGHVLSDGECAILRTGENRGYAGGNNVAFRYAQKANFDWVLILNNDTRFPKDFLDALVQAGTGSARVGMVGCAVLPMGKANYRPYRGGRLMYGLGVYLLWRWQNRQGTVPVNFVPGCATLVRTAMLDEVGLFDERFFLYTEDVDLSYRARRAGWKLLVNLDAQVEHDLSTSSGGARTPLYYYYVTRNTLLFISERLRGLGRPVSFTLFLAQSAARSVIWLLQRRWSHVRATWKGVRDFAGGQFGPAGEGVSRP